MPAHPTYPKAHGFASRDSHDDSPAVELNKKTLMTKLA